MTAVIISAAVIILLAVLMNFSVVIDVSYIGGKLDYRVKYFIFQIFPFKKFFSGKNKKKKADKTIQNNEKTEKKSYNTENFIEKSAEITEFIENSADDIKKAAKKIFIKDIYIDFVSRNEDASVCAVNYGIMNGIVYNILGVVCSLFRTTFRSVSIGLRYNQSGNIYDFSFKIKLKLWTGFKTAVSILYKFIKNKLKKTKENDI